VRIRLPELDTLPARTTIWPRHGHTFNKRGEAWFCTCEPFSAWRWANVKAWCDRYGIAAMDTPGRSGQVDDGIEQIAEQIAGQPVPDLLGALAESLAASEAPA
jgi:hypothetical protein